jgi:hypothetical protein
VKRTFLANTQSTGRSDAMTEFLKDLKRKGQKEGLAGADEVKLYLGSYVYITSALNFAGLLVPDISLLRDTFHAFHD